MIDNDNVNKLIEYVGEAVKPYLDSSLLDYKVVVDKKNVKSVVSSFLDDLKQKQGIANYQTKCEEANWEKYYPNMATRLLAIEAVDLIGNDLEVNEENTQLVKGYPYHKEYYLSVYYEDGGHDSYSLNEYESVKDSLEPHSYTEDSFYKIHDPTYMLIIDVYVRPIKPVEYIKFEVKKPDDMTIDEFNRIWSEAANECNTIMQEDI